MSQASKPGLPQTPSSQRLVRRLWWSGGVDARIALLLIVLVPASMAFRVVVALRNLLFDRRWRAVHEPVIPVVSIGNLTVGGTGKTPVTGWIVGRLRGGGVDPAVVSRGYGSDELMLHRRWHPGIPVIADRDRVAAVRTAAVSGASVAVLDDGFQYRRLARSVDIVLVGATDPLPPRLLPWGPWREGLGALRRADLVLVTTHSAPGAPEVSSRLDTLRQAVPGAPVLPLYMRFAGWTDLGGGPVGAPTSDRVLAVSSIARPERFAATVEEVVGGAPDILAFPDHWDYTREDVERIVAAAADRPVVTTEKDAVKLSSFGELLPDARVLTLEVGGREAEMALDGMLARFVGAEDDGGFEEGPG